MPMRSGNPPKTVTSAQNARVKALRRALSEGELVEGLCGLDSEHLIHEAVTSGASIETLFLAESRYSDAARRQQLLAGFDAEQTVVVPDPVLQSIVSTEAGRGVAALVRAPEWEADNVLDQQHAFVIVSAGIQDPGNLGTMVRSAEAFGGAALIVMSGTVSPFNSKALRASAGSMFRLPVLQMRRDPSEVIETLRRKGFELLAGDSHRGELATQRDFRGKTAIFIGNEGAGVPRAVSEALDGFVRIPHASTVESLNAGIAASLLLYEAYRQRLR